MADEQSKPKKLSMTSTKKEMLEAYGALLKQLQEKKESELKPAERLEEKKTREVVEITKSLSTDGVVKGINNLKIEIGTVLAEISDKMEREVQKFEAIQKAINAKEKEFQELYDIEKSAATFAALIEAQRQKREEFESEMERKREELDREIETAREQWGKEKSEHEALIKERDAEEKKKRARDEEEFSYAFKREQRLAKDRFGDEKIQLERERQLTKETMEKELAEREKIVAERERQLNELQGKVAGFPKELDVAVNQAVKDASDRVKAEAKNREVERLLFSGVYQYG